MAVMAYNNDSTLGMLNHALALEGRLSPHALQSHLKVKAVSS